jgi:hypothetical protein
MIHQLFDSISELVFDAFRTTTHAYVYNNDEMTTLSHSESSPVAATEGSRRVAGSSLSYNHYVICVAG